MQTEVTQETQSPPRAPFGCYCNKWQPYLLFTHHDQCPQKRAWEEHIEALKCKTFAFRLSHLPSMTVQTTSLYGGFQPRTTLRVEIPDLAAAVVERSAKVAAVLMCLERVVNFFGPKSKRVDALLGELDPSETNILQEMLQLQATINKELQA